MTIIEGIAIVIVAIICGVYDMIVWPRLHEGRKK